MFSLFRCNRGMQHRKNTPKKVNSFTFYLSTLFFGEFLINEKVSTKKKKPNKRLNSASFISRITDVGPSRLFISYETRFDNKRRDYVIVKRTFYHAHISFTHYIKTVNRDINLNVALKRAAMKRKSRYFIRRGR